MKQYQFVVLFFIFLTAVVGILNIRSAPQNDIIPSPDAVLIPTLSRPASIQNVYPVRFPKNMSISGAVSYSPPPSFPPFPSALPYYKVTFPDALTTARTVSNSLGLSGPVQQEVIAGRELYTVSDKKGVLFVYREPLTLHYSQDYQQITSTIDHDCS